MESLNINDLGLNFTEFKAGDSLDQEKYFFGPNKK